jgi:hypothetical protein
LQGGFADAAIWIVDIAVDHDAGMIAERKLSFVEERNLAPVRSSSFRCTGEPTMAVTAEHREGTRRDGRARIRSLRLDHPRLGAIIDESNESL